MDNQRVKVLMALCAEALEILRAEKEERISGGQRELALAVTHMELVNFYLYQSTKDEPYRPLDTLDKA